MERQDGDGGEVIVSDRLPFKVGAKHLLREEPSIRPADVQLFQAHLDRHLPRTRGTD